ncbi:MAG TPA: divalent-cation tolerance protein CutA [Bryobacteraceae bacterium]|jgi:periplasmic divalent cation tolerance protein
MPDFVAVFCTCRDQQEALHLANAVVEQRLAACVNVLPPVQSVYRWKEEVQIETEYLLLIKTTAARFAPLRDAITKLHSYETPEVLAVPVADGSDRYLAWIRESV